MILTMQHSDNGDGRKTSGCQGFGRERRMNKAQRVWGSETTLYDTVRMDTCHHAFVTNCEP